MQTKLDQGYPNGINIPVISFDSKLSFFSKVGQSLRSRSRDQTFWYGQKGRATRNVHALYESIVSFSSKDNAKVKFLFKSRSSESQGQMFWYQQKGHAARNTHMKY